MSEKNPCLEDFGFNSKELMIEVQRETMGKLIAAEKENARLRAALETAERENWALRRAEAMNDEDRAALIEMERQLLGYCELPQIKAILLRVTRMLLKRANEQKP